MGLADKFNELKDRITGAAEEAKGSAEEMLDQAKDSSITDQASEAAGNAKDKAQETIEDFKNEHGGK